MSKRWIVQKKTFGSFGYYDTRRYKWFICAAVYAASAAVPGVKYRVVDAHTYEYHL